MHLYFIRKTSLSISERILKIAFLRLLKHTTDFNLKMNSLHLIILHEFIFSSSIVAYYKIPGYTVFNV